MPARTTKVALVGSAIMLPIDPHADDGRRAWLGCPNCHHGESCPECQSGRNCKTHWQYLVRNDAAHVTLQCRTCAHLWITDTSKTDGYDAGMPRNEIDSCQDVFTSI